MICPNCGREARGKFCTSCGARLSDEAAPESGQQAAGGEYAEADVGATSAINPADLRDPDATSVIRPSDVRDMGGWAQPQEPTPMVPLEQAAPQAPAPIPDLRPSAAVVQQTAYAATATALVGAPGGYPVQVEFEIPPSNSRFWAIPLVGFVAKVIVLIPHIIILYALAIVTELLQLVTWIPVLSSGRYPDWGANIAGGTLRWGVRVYAFFYGLTDQYPPFSLSETAYPVQVSFQIPPSSNRLWAIPLVGILAKLIILIPHLVILYVFAAIVGLLQYILWAWVLFGGGYPDWGYTLVGGYLRWAVRVGAYLLGLNDQYPPFQLAS